MRGACVSQMFIRAYRPDERCVGPGLRQLFFFLRFFFKQKRKEEVSRGGVKKVKLQKNQFDVGFTTT